ncbi:MAG: prepilin-type N-terminal cleavage/methylation domain-containing protein [Pseudomonadota bacterium]
MRKLQKQNGFTLIEIAIVLVIIGLLLGGVLKGQELINSAKVKNLATDFRNVPVFIYGYQDKFKALPGDDAAAIAHVGASANGDGNGIIDGAYNATSGESFNFWQDVRLAGLAPGPTITTAADYIPRNAVGGQIGVTNAAQSPITGLKGSFIICSDGIPGKFAKQLDITLDDGNTATGSMMVAAVGSGGAPIPTTGTGGIVDDTTYLVCMGV